MCVRSRLTVALMCTRTVRQMLRQQSFVETAKHALYQLQAMRADQADHHKLANDLDIISNNLQYTVKRLTTCSSSSKPAAARKQLDSSSESPTAMITDRKSTRLNSSH